jgi:hypothetical protein
MCSSFHSSNEVSGTTDDVISVTRKLLNRSVVNRIIPKQECMVELDKLPLVLCTETIEPISISGSYQVKSSDATGVVARYRKVAPKYPNLSLYDFYNEDIKQRRRNSLNKNVIPHWIGGNGQPTYPVTYDYARTTLIVHKPWKASTPPRFTKEEWISNFNEFIASSTCPKSVKLTYVRMRERKLKKRHCEPTAGEECYDYEPNADMDVDTRDILSLVKTKSVSNDPTLNIGDFSFNKGINYDWSQRMNPVSRELCCIYHYILSVYTPHYSNINT